MAVHLAFGEAEERFGRDDAIERVGTADGPRETRAIRLLGEARVGPAPRDPLLDARHIARVHVEDEIGVGHGYLGVGKDRRCAGEAPG